MLGASSGELAFVAVMVAIVVLAQIAPRMADAISDRLARRQDGGGSNSGG